jgi:hypothetical protein
MRDPKQVLLDNLAKAKKKLEGGDRFKHGRNSRASTMVSGRQYATAVDGTVITFECEREKHAYKIDFSKKPLARRLGPQGARMMAGWWSREKGGCIGECPKCVRAARKETEPK